MSRIASVGTFIFLIGCVGLLLGQQRLQDSKDASLAPSYQDIIHTTKLTVPAMAELSILDEVVTGQEFTVQVLVKRNSEAENFSYELTNTPGLRLVAGRAVDSLYWHSGQLEQVLTFKLLQRSNRSERIGFILQSDSTGQKQRYSIGSLNYHRNQEESAALEQRQKVFLSNNPEALEVQKRATKKSDRHNH